VSTLYPPPVFALPAWLGETEGVGDVTGDLEGANWDLDGVDEGLTAEEEVGEV
jgi:hypothetical protein